MARQNLEQHTVPRFYLAGFAGPHGRVWVRDCKRGKTFLNTPENLTTESECYSVYTDDRRRDLSCDNTNQTVEQWCAPRIQSLSSQSQPTDEQWQAIWILTANLLSRSRRTRDAFSAQLEQTTDMVKEYLPVFLEDPLPPEIAKMFQISHETVTETPEVLKRAKDLHHPVTAALGTEPIAAELKTHGVALLLAPSDSRFITSDDPAVILENNRPIGMRIAPGFLARPDISVYLPLRSDLACLWSETKGFGTRLLTPEGIHHFNTLTLETCYTQVYAFDQSDFTPLV